MATDTSRDRLTGIASLALVAVLAAGFTALAIDGFTKDDAGPGRTVAGTASGSLTSPISGFAFESVTVTPGTTLTWVNEDSAPHTVTAVDGSFASGELDQGASFAAVFAAEGEYVVTCLIHPEMQGRVTVAAEGS